MSIQKPDKTLDQFATEDEQQKAADRAPKNGEVRPGFDLGGTTEEGRKGPHDVRPTDAGEGPPPKDR
jgi:hypothetical protein